MPRRESSGLREASNEGIAVRIGDKQRAASVVPVFGNTHPVAIVPLALSRVAAETIVVERLQGDIRLDAGSERREYFPTCHTASLLAPTVARQQKMPSGARSDGSRSVLEEMSSSSTGEEDWMEPSCSSPLHITLFQHAPRSNEPLGARLDCSNQHDGHILDWRPGIWGPMDSGRNCVASLRDLGDRPRGQPPPLTTATASHNIPRLPQLYVCPSRQPREMLNQSSWTPKMPSIKAQGKPPEPASQDTTSYQPPAAR